MIFMRFMAAKRRQRPADEKKSTGVKKVVDFFNTLLSIEEIEFFSEIYGQKPSFLVY